MFKFESKEIGNLLLVILKYIVNMMFDWQVNDVLFVNVNWMFYGCQKLCQYVEICNEIGIFVIIEVGVYFIVGIGIQYQLNWDICLNVGISNLFDK